MEVLAANGAMELFQRFVFARVPQPIVLPGKLTTAIVARIRLNCPMRIHVGGVFGFAYKCFRAHIAFEWFR